MKDERIQVPELWREFPIMHFSTHTHTCKFTHCDEYKSNIELEGTVPKTTFTSDTSCKLGVVPETLRFNTLLEPTELMKALRLTGMVYCKERIQTEISRERKCVRQSPWEMPNVELPLPPLHGVMDSLFARRWHGTTCRVSPAREAHPSLRVEDVHCGAIRPDWL